MYEKGFAVIRKFYWEDLGLPFLRHSVASDFEPTCVLFLPHVVDRGRWNAVRERKGDRSQDETRNRRVVYAKINRLTNRALHHASVPLHELLRVGKQQAQCLVLAYLSFGATLAGQGRRTIASFYSAVVSSKISALPVSVHLFPRYNQWGGTMHDDQPCEAGSLWLPNTLKYNNSILREHARHGEIKNKLRTQRFTRINMAGECMIGVVRQLEHLGLVSFSHHRGW